MAFLDSVLIAAGAIVLWTLLLYALQSRGVLEPRGLSPSPPPAGPFLLWKTVRGRQLIDRIARPARFWKGFGDLSIVLVALAMVGTTVLLIWEATLVQNPAVRGNPPSPDLLLGLPGINPIIPLGYGIFGLAVAIILHEFSHGILARAAKIKIRSLGLILLIVPIGAFVEPDEDEMRALPRRERARLYAAGPAVNLLLAILFAFLFSSIMMASVAPVHDGVGIVRFSEGMSPARDAGLQAYTVITELNATPVHTYSDFRTDDLHVYAISRDPDRGSGHGAPDHGDLCDRREHGLLSPADQPRPFRRRARGDFNLHLPPLPGTRPDRRSRDPLLSDQRAVRGLACPGLLAPREHRLLALLAKRHARGHECAAGRPLGRRLPLQGRDRGTRLAPPERDSRPAARPHRPERELHLRLLDPRTRAVAVHRSSNLTGPRAAVSPPRRR